MLVEIALFHIKRTIQEFFNVLEEKFFSFAKIDKHQINLEILSEEFNRLGFSVFKVVNKSNSIVNNFTLDEIFNQVDIINKFSPNDIKKIGFIAGNEYLKKFQEMNLCEFFLKSLEKIDFSITTNLPNRYKYQLTNYSFDKDNIKLIYRLKSKRMMFDSTPEELFHHPRQMRKFHPLDVRNIAFVYGMQYFLESQTKVGCYLCQS